MIEVMIVEDDPMVREINSKFLKRIEGFTLYEAVSNLEDAKKYIDLKKPDLILLDVYLPKENGIDFLKWIRAQEIDIDVILITADKSIERIQDAFRYGVIDYLIKPFSFERFKEALIQFKSRYYKFKKNDEIEQKDLDQLISSSNTSQSEDDFTKGLNKYTYRAIWDEVEKSNYGDVTAEELAEKLGIARVTVRRYLEYMEKENKIEKLVEYGKVGRPQYKYHRV
ncbi:response regulator [Clostridium folliculivorans]|uniref:Transcriptional regulatory protein n=1 Tax=Clostridium folliculivorans TaxID=2886038 RepID=A0A9W6DCR0_9CLOT|nr:response regulator [Clostridium folliculivorans]GKU27003.1 transcriptional regulatory protein [Clostridium folliculivorans]GKU29155.1 transcriptional regulatory protein [Clostridium folliculivorans]